MKCGHCRTEIELHTLMDLVKARCPSCNVNPIEHYGGASLDVLFVRWGLITEDECRTAKDVGRCFVDTLLNLRFTNEQRLSDLCHAILPRGVARALLRRGVLLWPIEGGISQVLEIQRRRGGALGDMLVQRGDVSEDELMLAIAAQNGMEVVNLDDLDISPNVLAMVPAEIARAYNILPVRLEGNTLVVAMSRPQDINVVDELRYSLRCELRGAIAPAEQIRRLVDTCYAPRQARPRSLLMLHLALVAVVVGAFLIVYHLLDLPKDPMRAKKMATLFGVPFIVGAVIGLLPVRTRWVAILSGILFVCAGGFNVHEALLLPALIGLFGVSVVALVRGIARTFANPAS